MIRNPRPLFPIARYEAAVLSGSNNAKSRDPSSGGRGIKLRIASKRFQLMIVARINPPIPEFSISKKG